MARNFKLIQVNLNRSWRALDLLKQYAIEADVGLMLISEPPRRLIDSATCFTSKDRQAAVIWRPEGTAGKFCRLENSGAGFVVVSLDRNYYISCYISPNVNNYIFSAFLDDIYDTVKGTNGSFLIGGDFNARSVLWESSITDRRGDLIGWWAAALDIRLLNVGDTHTCIRPQGSSVIDLSWATADLQTSIISWSVLESVESLSDHQYIEIVFTSSCTKSCDSSIKRRWNLKKLDSELFTAVVEFFATTGVPEDSVSNPEKYANWIVGLVSNACNVAAPIISKINRRRQMYCWSEEIFRLRVSAIRAKRIWTKSKRKGIDSDIHITKNRYRLAKRALRDAIKRAKNTSWKELVSTVDKDPWGLPYKLVMSKLRKSSPSLSDS